MSRAGYIAALVLFAAGCSEPAVEPEAELDLTGLSGEQIYRVKCEGCHSQPQTKAPPLATMRGLSRAAVQFALSGGRMKSQAEGLDFEQLDALITHVVGNQDSWQPPEQAWCEERRIVGGTAWSAGWGFEPHKTAAVGPDISSIQRENVANLQLAWAFELPQVTDARSQPVIVGDTLFLATTSGHLFAVDRESGCIRWHQATEAPLRTSLAYAELEPGEKTLFVGDTGGHMNAFDAADGSLRWRVDVAVSEHSMLTGSPVYHDGSLLVPVSTMEVILALDPDYECCTSHGALHRLDAVTGEIQWTLHTTEDATPQGKTRVGTRRLGPSGVAIWSTPTIDTKRDLVYVGTGQNASAPATGWSDAILAVRLDTGEVAWHFQATAGDTWNSACSAFPKGENCPKWQGPDFDFGASVIIADLPWGRQILLAGQKSGDVYALDPDKDGEVIWRTRVGAGSALGGVHWGMALREGRLLVAANDPPYPGYFPDPGLFALDVGNGEVIWKYSVERGCEQGMNPYFQREELYPACSFYYSFSAALSIANDVVFAPALDGKLRAFDAGTGDVLWQYETARSFETVGGASAHGGSIDSAGVQFAKDMAYVQSGYGLFGQLPGNVLLAFRLLSSETLADNASSAVPKSP